MKALAPYLFSVPLCLCLWPRTAVAQERHPEPPRTLFSDTVARMAAAELRVLIRTTPGLSGRLAGYHQRRARGIGRFVTRAEIERRQPGSLGEMLRGLPGIQVGRVELGPAPIRGRPACPLEYFLDGTRVSFFELDLVRPADVEGLEIYQGAARVPAAFTRRDSCGAILIWTREPNDN